MSGHDGSTHLPPPDPESRNDPERTIAGPPNASVWQSHHAGDEFESYSLQSLLGTPGGQGEVWKAKAITDAEGASVALKIYAGFGLTATKWCARECAALGRMCSGMPRHRANGQTKQGRSYLVMDLIPGETIAAFAERHALPLIERIGLVIDTGEKLHTAHVLGLLHRDIRSGNILVSAERVKPSAWIIDWGLASNTDDRAIAAESATIIGDAAGTPEYMAPEVVERGLLATSAASDVLSLGVVLHELVTGASLYDSSPSSDPQHRFESARVFWARDQHPKPIERLRNAREGARFDVTSGVDNDTRAHWEHALRTDLGRVLRCATHEELERRYRDVQAFLHDLRVLVGRFAEAQPQRSTASMTTAARQSALRCDQLLGDGDWSLRRTYADRVRSDAALLYGADALVKTRDFARAHSLLELVSPGTRSSWPYRYLSRKADPCIAVLPAGLKGGDPAFSPDGKHLYVPQSGSSAQLRSGWDARVKSELTGHGGPILGLEFNSDGSRALTLSEDGTVRWWDIEELRERYVFRFAPGQITGAFVSRDDKLVAVATVDNVVHLFSTTDGNKHETVLKLKGKIRDIDFSPDGRLIACGSSDSRAGVYSIRSGRRVWEFLDGDHGTSHTRFFPGGKRLLWVADIGGTIWMADAHNGKNVTYCDGPTCTARTVRISPDGTRILLVGESELAYLFDAETGKELGRIKGHGARVMWADFDHLGDRIVTASLDATARIWDARTCREIKCLDGHSGFVAFATFSPDNLRVATQSFDGTVRIWPASPIEDVTVKMEFESQSQFAVFSPDGSRFATTGMPGDVRLFNSVTGSIIWKSRSREFSTDSVAFHPDGKRIAVPSDSICVKLFDIATGQDLEVAGGGVVFAKSREDRACTLAFDPQGRYLAVASEEGEVAVIDSGGQTLLKRWTAHLEGIHSIAFDPTGEKVLTTSRDRTARVWNWATASELLVITPSGSWVDCADFSPDGSRIVTADSAGWCCLWDAATGECIWKFKADWQFLHWAQFSADGRYITTAGKSGTAKILDAATGIELIALVANSFKQDGPSTNVFSACFSRCGNKLLTAAANGTLHVWDATDPRVAFERALKLDVEAEARAWMQTIDNTAKYQGGWPRVHLQKVLEDPNVPTLVKQELRRLQILRDSSDRLSDSGGKMNAP